VITAVDTNVLIDILEPDPVHGATSKEALSRCLAQGMVTACEVVWAEVATAYWDKVEELLSATETLGIGYSAMLQESALKAARHWYMYRQRGGSRQRIAADFLIGAHALRQCDRLLTRDRGFYRDNYRSLVVINPGVEPAKPG
jgi:hypothetical protein